jgi:hypothetical protein
VNRLLADFVVVVHFAWILFMLAGIILTICAAVGVYVLRVRGGFWERYFDWWIFRTLHGLGIVFVAILPLIGRYCPLTIIEYILRRNNGQEVTESNFFIVRQIERFVYPEVDPELIVSITVIVAGITLFVYAARPPAKIKKILKGKFF